MTSFWRNNDVIIAQCVCWGGPIRIKQIKFYSIYYRHGITLDVVKSEHHYRNYTIKKCREAVKTRLIFLVQGYSLETFISFMWLSHYDIIKWKLFPRYLSFCAENSPVTGEFPTQNASNVDTDVSLMWVRFSCKRSSLMTGDLRLHDVHVTSS